MTLHTTLLSCALVLLQVYNTPSVFAQYAWTQPEAHASTHLKAVDFSSELVGYVAGDGGTLLKTTDGGQTWVKLNSTTSVNLWNVKASGGNNVIAVGDNATILISTDAGSTWTKKNSPMGTGEFLFGIQVYDNNTFYLSGGRFKEGFPVGAFMRSIDAGESWTLIGDIPEAFFMDRVHFVSPDIGYAVGASIDFGKGLIVKTTDGGATWTIIRNTDGVVNSLAVHDAQSITAVASLPLITRTSDGGVTWTDQSSEIAADVISVIYVSTNHGFIAGDLLLETFDGGANWNTLEAPGGVLFNGISYQSSTGTVIAVGNNGVIVRGVAQNSVETSGYNQVSFVWPNPAEDHFQLQIAGHITITDLTGKNILERDVLEGGKMDVGSLPAGMYWLIVRRSNGTSTREKLIVQ